jgi:L-ascorbate metabolism protein UlaG (beta-lactamase superfamily)
MQRLTRFTLWAIVLVASAVSCAYVIFHPRFGQDPSGARLERIQQSLNYRNDEFQNIEPTIYFRGRASHRLRHGKAGRIGAVLAPLYSFLCKELQRPDVTIPSKKTPLHELDPNKDQLVWFGHSSYLIQIDGKRIIVDPVLSKVASPFLLPRAFAGSDTYTPQDIPPVDILFITHDHYDHLDYRTVRKLKFTTVVCPLGVGAHLERFGVDKSKIIELDWNESVKIDEFTIHCLTARHWSRRGYNRNKTLWGSFLVRSPSSFKIYIGGDSGYGTHFKAIGEIFGPVDLAILENGQYNKRWPQVHMKPEETQQAAQDLRAKAVLPVHFAKFSLSTHPWNESIEQTSNASADKSFRLLTPMIGEVVFFKDPTQTFKKWWR